MIDYRKIITIEAGKRGGRPCIRGMRITVYDILSWLAAGMSKEEILEDYPELQAEDIQAALSYADVREPRPNWETQQALKDAESGKGTRFKDTDELFKKLGF